MAKILTDKDMAQIIHRTVHEDIIDDSEQYSDFLEDLCTLIIRNFGGQRGRVGRPDADLGWTCGFHINECVPPDGGIYKDYDTDVIWLNGEEAQT